MIIISHLNEGLFDFVELNRLVYIYGSELIMACS